MLTLRGEHFYFVAKYSCYTVHYAPDPRSACDKPARTDLARPAGVAAQRPAAARHGMGDQPAAGAGDHRFPPFPGPAAAGDALGLQAHPRCRGGLDFARQSGNLADIWKLVALELALAIAQRCPRPGEHPLRQPAGRPLHQPGQRAPDGACLPARPGVVRRPGLLRQAGPRPPPDHRPPGPAGRPAQHLPGHPHA